MCKLIGKSFITKEPITAYKVVLKSIDKNIFLSEFFPRERTTIKISPQREYEKEQINFNNIDTINTIGDRLKYRINQTTISPRGPGIFCYKKLYHYINLPYELYLLDLNLLKVTIPIGAKVYHAISVKEPNQCNIDSYAANQIHVDRVIR